MDKGSDFSSDPLSADGTLQRGIHRVGDSLHGGIDKVVDPVHGVVERASASAHQAVDRLASGVASAAQNLDERLDKARATPRHAVDCARDYVAARPLKAVALAFAVGWVWGRIGANR
ncbi:hypothetical protein LJR039_004195 [Pseudorhodoferax sp. LjRoot39]|uniref:DUF883 family protein n=1 Tax=Pseudorhodoferax sp. LjRoot39 TaxID=3342328 RepID=UPI003ED11802